MLNFLKSNKKKMLAFEAFTKSRHVPPKKERTLADSLAHSHTFHPLLPDIRATRAMHMLDGRAKLIIGHTLGGPI